MDALLTEYKELVLKYEALARGLQERNAGLARQLGVTGTGCAGPGQSESASGAENVDGEKAVQTGSVRTGGSEAGEPLEALDGMPRGAVIGRDAQFGEKETTSEMGTGDLRAGLQEKAPAPRDAGNHVGGPEQAGSQPQTVNAESGDETTVIETVEQNELPSKAERGQEQDSSREGKVEAQESRAESEALAGEPGEDEVSRKAESERGGQESGKSEVDRSAGEQSTDDTVEHGTEADKSIGETNSGKEVERKSDGTPSSDERAGEQS